MTRLERLDVSLTKHGAHKIALLLGKYNKDEVLNHLSDNPLGIDIEGAQAKKNLSASSSGNVPDLWNEARQRGTKTVNALVLLAIISSHHKLISAMKTSLNLGSFKGRIIREVQLNGKAYTNFAHTLEQLGYGKSASNYVDFDLEKLFELEGLSQLAKKLFALKLKSAGWKGGNSIEDELLKLEFDKVFAVPKQKFRNWLGYGTISGAQSTDEVSEDMDFFFEGDDRRSSSQFKFKPGHNKKKTGTVPIAATSSGGTKTLLHNEIQTALFDDLVKQFGRECVGTENNTGSGTSIDVVVKTKQFCQFYEIKIADSVKATIRQAIPQLLEYAYWQGDDMRANQLIIVSPLRITKEAKTYLDFLKVKFGLPFEYLQFGAKPK